MVIIEGNNEVNLKEEVTVKMTLEEMAIISIATGTIEIRELSRTIRSCSKDETVKLKLKDALAYSGILAEVSQTSKKYLKHRGVFK